MDDVIHNKVSTSVSPAAVLFIRAQPRISYPPHALVYRRVGVKRSRLESTSSARPAEIICRCSMIPIDDFHRRITDQLWAGRVPCPVWNTDMRDTQSLGFYIFGLRHSSPPLRGVGGSTDQQTFSTPIRPRLTRSRFRTAVWTFSILKAVRRWSEVSTRCQWVTLS